MRQQKLIVFSLMTVFISLASVLAAKVDIVGTWQGNLQVPGQSLRMVIHISVDDDQQFSAKMDSPDQGAKNIPVSEVLFSDGELLLMVKSIGGEYKGVLQDDKQSFKGTWQQSGYEFPLDLDRSGDGSVKKSANKVIKTKNVDSEIILETSTGKLYGTLEVPDSEPPYPVVLIIAGSGPTDRDGNNPRMQNNSLKMLATELLKKGIASLRYDKRGIAKSRGAGLKESDLRFEHYVDDAKDWINFLSQDNRFREVIVAGHSEGSLIGMIASQQKNVASFISLAGAGQSADKIIREQLTAQPPQVLEQASPILDKLVRGEVTEDVPQMLNSLLRPSIQPYMISWFKYNPQVEIAKLEKPVLIIQGTTDIQVSVEEAARLAKANPNAKKQIISGMNHILKEAESDRQKNALTYNQPDLPLKSELINIIVDFISN